MEAQVVVSMMEAQVVVSIMEAQVVVSIMEAQVVVSFVTLWSSCVQSAAAIDVNISSTEM